MQTVRVVSTSSPQPQSSEPKRLSDDIIQVSSMLNGPLWQMTFRFILPGNVQVNEMAPPVALYL